MMKNGRPYSSVVLWEDSKLLTDESIYTFDHVLDWIRSNIEKDEEAKPISGYRIHRVFFRDTGIELTENQFKDGMLIAGYRPINPNELTWRYRVRLTCQDANRPKPFLAWLQCLSAWPEMQEDILVYDLVHDPCFPAATRWRSISRYLRRCDVGREKTREFKKLWKQYKEATKHG